MPNTLITSPQIPIVMTSRSDLLFVSIHGAFLTFDPSYDAASQTASDSAASAQKGACGKCTFCKCKRAKG